MIRKQHQHRWKNRFQKERDKSVGAPDVCFPPESKKTNYFRVENLTRARVSRCFRGFFSLCADFNSRFSHGVVCQSLGAQTSLAASAAQPHPVSIRRHVGAENVREAESPRWLISIALQTSTIQTAARRSGVLSLRCRAGKQSGGHVKRDRSADGADLLAS